MCDFSDTAEQGLDRAEGMYLDEPRAEDSSYTSRDLAGWERKCTGLKKGEKLRYFR